jgi:nucleoside 2-deoxyribosyltransferase
MKGDHKKTMTPNKMIFYLIGQISSDKRTYSWREDIVKRFSNNEKIDFYNPCDNKFSQMALKLSETPQQFNEFIKANPQFSQTITPRDMAYVFSSDGAICNLNNYSPESPFIGTYFELAWYKLTPQKPVIGVYENDHTKSQICRNPCVWSTITLWTKTIDEACDTIQTMFL